MLDIVYFLIGTFVLVWILTFILLSKDIFKTGAVKVHKVKIRKKESFWVIMLIYIICLGIIIGTFIKTRPATEWYNYIGAAMVFIGGLMRVYARKALGRFFSFQVVIQKGHKLITTGVYKYTRHPMYLSMTLILFGLAIALSSLYGVIVLLILYVPAVLYRISAEEELLIKEFGNDYLNYMEKTKKMIPYLY